MLTSQVHPLQAYIARGFAAGKHERADGPICVLEGCALARGLPITDDPLKTLGIDLRPLNDASHWRDEHHRAEHIGPTAIALWDYREWTPERQKRFATRLAELTLAPRTAAGRCESEGTQASAAAALADDAAASAAYAADDAAASAYAYALAAAASAYAYAAAHARAAHARAAHARAAHAAASVLESSCALFVQAARESEASE